MNKLQIVFKIISMIFISILKILKNKTFFGGIRISRVPKENCLSILGTGPSLVLDLKRDFNKIKESTIMVVNDFATSKEYEILKPSSYILADPGYWMNEKDTTEDNIVIRNELFKNILTKTNWEMTIFVPKGAFAFLNELLNANKYITVKKYNALDLNDYENFWGFYCLKNNFASPCVNVLGVSIYLGINMGYKKINLYGADHSWTEDIIIDNLNRVLTVSKHFYESDRDTVKIWLKANNTPYKFHEILSDLSKTFYNYQIINKYAILNNVSIFNLSSKSFIDAFNR